jgi:hypothetical protein
MLSLESTGSRAIGSCKALLQRPFTFDEILADIERVTMQEVKALEAASWTDRRWSRSAQGAEVRLLKGSSLGRARDLPLHRPEMGALWSEGAVRALAPGRAGGVRGLGAAGRRSRHALDRIRQRARVDAARIEEIEGRVRHVGAFPPTWKARSARLPLRRGAPSSVVDTAAALARGPPTG